MRKLLAGLTVLATVLSVLWVAAVAGAGEAEVWGDCDNWYVTVRTLGSNPTEWSATLDGEPVEDGTYTIPDTVNETRTFTIVWTRARDGRQDTKLFIGERTLNCGTTTTAPTVPDTTTTTICDLPMVGAYDPCVPEITTTTLPSSSTTNPAPSTSVPVTLPFTGGNPIQTGVLGVVLLMSGGLVWMIANSRVRDE